MYPFEVTMDEKLIFVVDDDKVILHLLEYTFRSRGGYQVRSFSTGEELLANINEKPDLIVLDHQFNESMSGLEILKNIRLRFPTLPVIILTGEEGVDLTHEFINKGAHKLIHKKDYFIDTLIESVENIFPN